MTDPIFRAPPYDLGPGAALSPDGRLFTVVGVDSFIVEEAEDLLEVLLDICPNADKIVCQYLAAECKKAGVPVP